MDLEQAVEISKQYIDMDRELRSNKVESDYDKYCELRCQALERILEEINIRSVNE